MKSRPYAALLAATTLVLAACGTDDGSGSANDSVTVTNCSKEVSFPSPAKELFVNDGNLISMLLSIGAEDQIAAVSSVGSDEELLTETYGKAFTELNQISDSDDYPSLEAVIGQRPDVMVAGWNYGYDETKNLTPESLATYDIGAYTLTESCRQQDGERARGIVEPWDALREDLTNLGTITGHKDEAAEVNAEIRQRLSALNKAPQPKKAPVLFVFDSGEKAIYTSGSFGAPQAIIEAAGGTNAVGDIKDTWTEVSWERLASARPDAFLFVDYAGQTFEQKVEILKDHPATRDLPAVKQERFLNLTYAKWTSGPLNVDAAEEVRDSLEEWELAPAR